MKDSITIVIPTYNEENYILPTLWSIDGQVGIENVDVIIADGGSTDNTVDNILMVQNLFKFKIHIIKGGSASEGRNAGAKYIKKPIVLFMDADTTIDHPQTIMNGVNFITNSGYDLVTTKIRSSCFGVSKIAFMLFEWVHSLMKESFSTGVFFMTRRSKFEELGGFDESLKHTEDYILSRQYNFSSLHIMKTYVTQDNRRFKKMGYFRFVVMLIKNYINRNNIEHFRKDIGYW